MTGYIAVQPREHDAACRRRMSLERSQFYGLDRERCERCRALWVRLDEAHAALKRRGVL